MLTHYYILVTGQPQAHDTRQKSHIVLHCPKEHMYLLLSTVTYALTLSISIYFSFMLLLFFLVTFCCIFLFIFLVPKYVKWRYNHYYFHWRNTVCTNFHPSMFYCLSLIAGERSGIPWTGHQSVPGLPPMSSMKYPNNEQISQKQYKPITRHTIWDRKTERKPHTDCGQFPWLLICGSSYTAIIPSSVLYCVCDKGLTNLRSDFVFGFFINTVAGRIVYSRKWVVEVVIEFMKSNQAYHCFLSLFLSLWD